MITQQKPHWDLCELKGIEGEIKVDIAGLFTLTFKIGQNGYPVPKSKHLNTEGSWFERFFENQDFDYLDFRSSGFSHSWEARYAVVQNYVEIVNQLTGRNTQLSIDEVKRHWRRKLVLPIEICRNLTNEEYAILVEKTSPESPIQIQAKAVRHYPQGYLGSHVLGYVGSGYEANPDTKAGADLATFELQGKNW